MRALRARPASNRTHQQLNFGGLTVGRQIAARVSNRPPCCLEPSEVGKTHPTTTELSSRRARLNRVFVSAWIDPDQSSLVVALPCVLPPTRTVLTPLADCSTTSCSPAISTIPLRVTQAPQRDCGWMRMLHCCRTVWSHPNNPRDFQPRRISRRLRSPCFLFDTEVGGQSDTIACNCRQPLWPPADRTKEVSPMHQGAMLSHRVSSLNQAFAAVVAHSLSPTGSAPKRDGSVEA
jgi:hypothetical protein